MHLFLSGGGNKEDSKYLDELFAKSIDKNKILLYIPIAIDKNKHPYLECLKWLKNIFEPLGVRKYKLISEHELKKLTNKDLARVGGIYIGGGNTFYLLSELKKTLAISFIKKALNQNIPIYGGSAGAIIFGKTIKTSFHSDINQINLINLNAINSLNNFEIFCHFKKNFNETLIFFNKYKLKKVFVLSNKTGLIFFEDKISIIGEDSAFLFNNNKFTELKFNSTLALSRY